MFYLDQLSIINWWLSFFLSLSLVHSYYGILFSFTVHLFWITILERGGSCNMWAGEVEMTSRLSSVLAASCYATNKHTPKRRQNCLSTRAFPQFLKNKGKSISLFSINVEIRPCGKNNILETNCFVIKWRQANKPFCEKHVKPFGKMSQTSKQKSWYRIIKTIG